MSKDNHKNDKQDNTEVELLNNRIEELDNSWKRALADYMNLQKRAAEERYEIVRYANQSLLLKFLRILDGLELATEHTKDTGLELVLKDFKQILNEEGIEEIEALGKDFDFQTMEAIEMVSGENGKVVEVINKGYKMRDKILRNTKVKVGNGKSDS